MTVSNFNEHKLCHNYNTGVGTGFKTIKLNKGDTFVETPTKFNHLFFIRKGKIAVSFDETKGIFNADSVFFIPKYSCIEIEVIEDTFVLYHEFDDLVHLCGTFELSNLVSFCKNRGYEFESFPIPKALIEYSDTMCYYLEEQLLCRRMFDIKHQELFLLLSTFYSKEDCAKMFFPIICENPDFMNQVMVYYNKAKNINELAEKCNLSVPTFNRKFKQCFKTSPYRWMLSKKTEEIKKKLLNLDVAISEIIEEFDFSSSSHFTSYCKMHLKMTPTEYRRKYATKGLRLARPEV